MAAQEHDLVIVGAGSAGCVLANRLSEDASVVLIEAGPIEVPPNSFFVDQAPFSDREQRGLGLHDRPPSGSRLMPQPPRLRIP